MEKGCGFDELMFFAQMKAKPGLFIGRKSIISLRDYLHGMGHAFRYSGEGEIPRYFSAFAKWYIDAKIGCWDGYACWWNHILYICGNHDDMAFDCFFSSFESYLMEQYGLSLPEAE